MYRQLRLKIVSIILTLAGIVMSVVGYQEMDVPNQIKSGGTTTPGQLVDRSTVSGRRGRVTYKLDVAYRPGESGPVQRREFSVPKKFFGAASPDIPLTVRYLPSDPSVSEIVGAEPWPYEKIGPGVIMMLAGAGMAYFAFRKRDQGFSGEPVQA